MLLAAEHVRATQTRRRRNCTTSVLNLPPTSVPTTTRRHLQARPSSGYVLLRLRRAAALTALPGCTSARRWAWPCRVRFMSVNRTLRAPATSAPASRQMHATACSRGKACVDSTPEVAGGKMVAQGIELPVEGAPARAAKDAQAHQEHAELGWDRTSWWWGDIDGSAAKPACESSSAREFRKASRTRAHRWLGLRVAASL